jgi:molybdenum cofactor cytidylyltransferase
MTDSPRIVAVVLAAGAGTRFAGPGHKLHADLGGRTVLARALDHAVEADIGTVVVVVAEPGAHPLPAGVLEVVNPRWADGQATSLWAGIDAAAALGADAVVVGLGDQPGIEPTAWRAVAMIDAAIVVATYDGRPGHPVRLAADVWPRLPRSGDTGARAVVREHPELVQAVPCGGSPSDIDTQEDLRQWQSNSSTSSP